MISAYTDGSATKTRSGWGWIAISPSEYNDTAKNAGTAIGATNQRMELMAALDVLYWWETGGNYLWEPDDDITIYTDSAYLFNCWADRWYVNWNNNGWFNSKGMEVANKDLWQALLKYFTNPKVKFEKVKGHSGHPYNELADKLAIGAIKRDQDALLKIQEKNDKINIELSEILLDYSMKKYPVDETIKRIRKACNCG